MEDDKKQILTEEDYIPKQAKFRHPILTQEEFDKIKELSFRGEATKEIAAAINRGVSTVSRARGSDTYGGYFEKSRKYSGKYKKGYSEESGFSAVDVKLPGAVPSIDLDALADMVAERVVRKLVQRMVR